MRRFHKILFLIVIPCLASCVPHIHDEQIANGASGTILDSKTLKPIHGASVSYEHFPKSTVHTASDGTFVLEPLSKLRFYSVALGDSIWRFIDPNIIVLASGYESTVKEYDGLQVKPLTVKLSPSSN